MRLLTLLLVAMLPIWGQQTFAGESCHLIYKFKPGQIWEATFSSRMQTFALGSEHSVQNEFVIEYHVNQSKRSGWLALSARIMKQSNDMGVVDTSGMDMSRLKFMADMHPSGDIRNRHFTGSVYSDEALAEIQQQDRQMAEEDSANMQEMLQMERDTAQAMQEQKDTIMQDPDTTDEVKRMMMQAIEQSQQRQQIFTDMKRIAPDRASMMKKSGELVAKGWFPGVFWFPELPDGRLEIGDEFEVERKSGLNDSMIQSQTISREVFTLEDISSGLAYFSVRDRTVLKAKSMGGSTDAKIGGKGEAVFDLGLGTWTKIMRKSRSLSQISGLPGGDTGTSEIFIHNKMEMILQ